MILLPLLPFATALVSRLRGRGTLGNQPDRLIVALVTGLPILVSEQYLAYGVFSFLTWAAFTPGWAAWMNVRTWRQWFFMNLRGLLITLPYAFLPFLGSYSNATALFALSGLAMGSIYFVGRRMQELKALDSLSNDPIANSEVLFGFYLGLVALASFSQF